MPNAEKVSAAMTATSVPTTMPTKPVISGVTSAIDTSFERTVAAFDTGIDFQNRTLRSRRSS
jgi:hypothetical protein